MALPSMRSILRPYKRRPLMPILLLLQIAFALAVVCNMLHLVGHELQPLLLDTGLDAEHLAIVDGLFTSEGMWQPSDIDLGEQSARSFSNVDGVSAIFGLPLLQSARMQLGLRSNLGRTVKTEVYLGDDLIKVLGLHLIAGRNFTNSEYLQFGIGPGATNSVRSQTIQPLIITKELAKQWFGSSPALGKVLTDVDFSAGKFVIVGVVNHLIGDISSEVTGEASDNAVLLPYRIGKTMFFSMAIHRNSSVDERFLREIRGRIEASYGARLNKSAMRVSSYSDLRRQTFANQRASIKLFGAITFIIVVLTIVSIMGFTIFWVQQRTKQIGIRRALGARKMDIALQFLTENLVIVAAAIPVGLTLACFGSILLMKNYEVSKLPFYYLPLSSAIMIGLGQLAAFLPAFRAARVPPAVATRGLDKAGRI